MVGLRESRRILIHNRNKIPMDEATKGGRFIAPLVCIPSLITYFLCHYIFFPDNFLLQLLIAIVISIPVGIYAGYLNNMRIIRKYNLSLTNTDASTSPLNQTEEQKPIISGFSSSILNSLESYSEKTEIFYKDKRRNKINNYLMLTMIICILLAGLIVYLMQSNPIMILIALFLFIIEPICFIAYLLNKYYFVDLPPSPLSYSSPSPSAIYDVNVEAVKDNSQFSCPKCGSSKIEIASDLSGLCFTCKNAFSKVKKKD